MNHEKENSELDGICPCKTSDAEFSILCCVCYLLDNGEKCFLSPGRIPKANAGSLCEVVFVNVIYFGSAAFRLFVLKIRRPLSPAEAVFLVLVSYLCK